MKRLSKCFAVLSLLALAAVGASAAEEKFDVVIAGGGMGGMGAAIQAARMGKTVLVVEPSGFLGGQAVAAGVSTMDDLSAHKSGIYLEFVNRVSEYYKKQGKSIGTCYWEPYTVAFEPFVGQKLLAEMAAECSPSPVILYHAEVITVQKDGDTVTGVAIRTRDDNRQIGCKTLIDATEYGDVLPLAAPAYRSGNEVFPNISGNSMVQDITWTAVMRKYPDGVPERLCPKTPLPGYEQAKANYEKYVTKDGFDFQNVYPVQLPVNFVTHNGYRGLPNTFDPTPYDGSQPNWPKISKTSVNWGNDYPGAYKWKDTFGLPAAYFEDKALRAQVEREALVKTLHFIYYVQNELGENWSIDDAEYGELPEAARDLPDEWKELARHMPPIPYVRESRRAVGDFTLTAKDLYENSLSWRDGNKSREFSDAVAIGGYIIDLHHSATDADLEKELGESAASVKQLEPRAPFQAPLRALIPAGVDGLLAAEKNLSMSRLASGAMRLQPICMMTGQAAGALAAIAVQTGRRIRDVHPILVQRVLLEAGVIVSTLNYADVPVDHPQHAGVVLSTLYGLLELREYPSFKSYGIQEQLCAALAEEIAAGHDLGRFGVDEPLTRQEAAQMAAKAREALKMPAKELSVGESGASMTKSEFASFTAAALDLQTDEASQNTENKPVTRGEAAELMTRAMERAALK